MTNSILVISSPNTLSNFSSQKWVQQEVSMVQGVLLSKVGSSRNRLRTCFDATWVSHLTLVIKIISTYTLQQLNTSPAKPVNHQTLFSPRKTVSSSWPVSHVGVEDQSMPSRVDSRRKLGREVRTRRVDWVSAIAVASVYVG